MPTRTRKDLKARGISCESVDRHDVKEKSRHGKGIAGQLDDLRRSDPAFQAMAKETGTAPQPGGTGSSRGWPTWSRNGLHEIGRQQEKHLQETVSLAARKRNFEMLTSKP